MKLTDDEARVVDILVKAGKSPSMSNTQIHAVDRAMGWASVDTRKFVSDLEDRGLIVRRMSSFNRLEQGEAPPMAQSWWEVCDQKDE